LCDADPHPGDGVVVEMVLGVIDRIRTPAD
jgi:hypothetical protein